jgi:hypothetical protein
LWQLAHPPTSGLLAENETQKPIIMSLVTNHSWEPGFAACGLQLMKSGTPIIRAKMAG